MDYHVFIPSRIRESYDRTGKIDQAVVSSSLEPVRTIDGTNGTWRAHLPGAVSP